MRQSIKVLALLITVLLAVQFAPVMFAEAGGVTVSIPAGVTLAGTPPAAPDTFSVTLTALDGAPEPTGGTTKTFTGAGSYEFGPIDLPNMGVYRYEVSQSVATSSPMATEYDNTVYLVEFFVTNTGGPAVVITPIRPEKGDKVDKIEFVNTYAKTMVTATKVWDDNENQDGKRDDVALTLSGTAGKDNTAVPVSSWTEPEKTIAIDAASLSVTWDELPLYYNGEEITYAVSEKGVVEKDGMQVICLKDDAEYTVSVSGNMRSGFTVTNAHEPEETEITVEKIWDDNKDQDGKRPDELIVTLLADGKPARDADGKDITVTLTEEKNWKGSVDGLPVYKDGAEIAYTWTEKDEDISDDYKLTSSVTKGAHTILTNKHETKTTTATVTKIWDDNKDQDGFRPDEIVVTLLADGKAVETYTLTAKDDWQLTVSDLPANKDGNPIVYTWSEAEIKNYRLTGNKTEGTETTLTNTRLEEHITTIDDYVAPGPVSINIGDCLE